MDINFKDWIKFRIIYYLIPCLIWIISSLYIKNKVYILIIFHILLIINIIFTYIKIKKYYNIKNYLNKFWIIIYFLSILWSVFFVWKIWLFYGLSSLIQELSIIFTSVFLKFKKFEFIKIYLLITIPFILAHNLDWFYKIFLLWFWCFLSIKMFLKWINIFYIISIHNILWSILIYHNLIYK